MVIRRVGPLSFAKITGVLYGLMGLIVGALISILSVVRGTFAPHDADAAFPEMLFGAAAVILLPIFYGVIGFVFSLVGAALYNVVAAWVGGVELDVQ